MQASDAAAQPPSAPATANTNVALSHDDTSKVPGPPESSDNFDTSNSFCTVCGNGDSFEDNPIVICDSCFCAVHANCYQVTKAELDAPNWFCHSCKEHIARKLPDGKWNPELNCKACKRDGVAAMYKVKGGGWCHAACAAYIPEIAVTDGVADLSRLLQSRCSLECSACQQPGGACIQCNADSCYTAFHPWCAVDRHWYNEIMPYPRDDADCFYAVYCAHHQKTYSEHDDDAKFPYITQGCCAVSCRRKPQCPHSAAEMWDIKRNKKAGLEPAVLRDAFAKVIPTRSPRVTSAPAAATAPAPTATAAAPETASIVPSADTSTGAAAPKTSAVAAAPIPRKRGRRRRTQLSDSAQGGGDGGIVDDRRDGDAAEEGDEYKDEGEPDEDEDEPKMRGAPRRKRGASRSAAATAVSTAAGGETKRRHRARKDSAAAPEGEKPPQGGDGSGSTGEAPDAATKSKQARSSRKQAHPRADHSAEASVPLPLPQSDGKAPAQGTGTAESSPAAASTTTGKAAAPTAVALAPPQPPVFAPAISNLALLGSFQQMQRFAQSAGGAPLPLSTPLFPWQVSAVPTSPSGAVPMASMPSTRRLPNTLGGPHLEVSMSPMLHYLQGSSPSPAPGMAPTIPLGQPTMTPPSLPPLPPHLANAH